MWMMSAPASPDRTRETGTNRRACDRRRRFEAPEGDAVRGFAHLAVAVVDDDDLKIDMAREHPQSWSRCVSMPPRAGG